MSDETETEKQKRIAELDRQIAIRNTSLSTGVPPGLLGNGRDATEIEEIAAAALAWRQEEVAPPPTAAAAYSVGQYSRENLRCMTAAQVTEAYAQGQLASIGGA